MLKLCHAQCRVGTAAVLANPLLFGCNGKYHAILPVFLAVVKRMSKTTTTLELPLPRREVHLGQHCAGCETCVGAGFAWKTKAVAMLLVHLCKTP